MSMQEPSARGTQPEATAPAEEAALKRLQQEPHGPEEEVDLQMLMDVPLTLSVEVGKTRMTVRELLQLGQGSIVDLDRDTDAPLDLLVNGTLIAQGEVVTIGSRFGLRLIDVISPRDRLQKLR